ncbi:hypothetical protein MKW98_027511, partial [Papaver atlanticum]
MVARGRSIKDALRDKIRRSDKIRAINLLKSVNLGSVKVIHAQLSMLQREKLLHLDEL